MKMISLATALGFVFWLTQASALAAEPDWDEIDSTEIMLFYPGVASIEWVLGDIRVDDLRHEGARTFRMGERCTECHLEDPGELVDIGDLIAKGESMEPAPIPGKAGTVPAEVQAAYSDDTLYLRFRWKQPPASGGTKMDAANPVKFGVMLDAGKVELADQGGCWASCHADLQTMPDGTKDKLKYVKDASLADGVYYDLLQWRSGEDKKYDGHVADTRVMEGGTALQRAEGTLDGDTWTVVFERKFTGGQGDIALKRGEVYNIGAALHDNHAAGRFHHVTMGYSLGIDAEADIVAKSQ